MSKEINTNMKDIILGWGIPNISELKNIDIQYVFDSSKIPNVDEYYQDLRCEHNNVKFCLYDFDNNKIIFSMDFWESNNGILSLTGESQHFRLELLNVNDHQLRNKGIASYYLNKLQEYAIQSDMSFIKVKPCANDEIFNNDSEENSLKQDELINFYRKKSTKEMPIKLLGYEK
ncbi:hypothetical protein [Romboutsia hominis]|uniref:hypothetical protein n=1 Tax=Romboutsia hominis TaxID=1507512 RepID=UPI001F05AD93|nr:hypothetical protein [Romboutsia hominis]MCH1959703.1 hypothetical protein [Romboutsia hominis]MCH1969874.1 hypothetical protein [Romboutsia hominis]